METAVLRVPKTFYVKERDSFYSRWQESFWRELIQNSVDAGSKEIRITMSMEKARGPFGRAAPDRDVIRIAFEDDGCGMTADVLDNVYFRPGESTKTGAGQVGGYGRARLLTCFSQARYAIVTQDRAVEGDGPEYVHRDIPGMVKEVRKLRKKLEADAVSESSDELQRRIDGLKGQEADLEAHAKVGAYKGCRVEVDIDPEEYGVGNWRNPSMDNLARALTSYLKISQLPCKVFFNGEERKERLLRGPARKTLTAKRADGVEVEFANVHLSQSKKAEFKQQTIVRVNGAAMFEQELASDYQVIVELKPEISREAMTSNRDGLRDEFKAAFELFRDQLIADTRSALDDASHKWVDVAGSYGVALAQPPVREADYRSPAPAMSDVEPVTAQTSTARSDLEQFGYAGIPFAALKRFFGQFQYSSGGDGFLSDYGHNQLRWRLSDELSSRDGVELVRHAIEIMTDAERGFVLGVIRDRLAEAEKGQQIAFERKLAGMHDAVIHINGDLAPKVRDAFRRNHPDKWDVTTGAGQRMRSLLAVWTTSCEVALQTLMRREPYALSGSSNQWKPGFVYAETKKEYRFGEYKEAYSIEAEYANRDDVHVLMVNPVNSEGQIKYNVNDPADRQRLMALAMHEVCHIIEKYHNEDFSSLMTEVMASFDYREANKRMNAALKTVREAYSEGRVRAQAMDDQSGPRPADRLMAALAPTATAMTGVLGGENEELAPATQMAFARTRIRDEDGSTVYDVDALNELEARVSHAVTHGSAHVFDDEVPIAASPSV